MIFMRFFRSTIILFTVITGSALHCMSGISQALVIEEREFMPDIHLIFSRQRDWHATHYKKMLLQQSTQQEIARIEYKIPNNPDQKCCRIEYKIPNNLDPNCCRIEWLATEDAFLRQGYARKLLDMVCDELSQKGYPRVQLLVHVTNKEAQALYQKVGFTMQPSKNTVYHLYEKVLINQANLVAPSTATQSSTG